MDCECVCERESEFLCVCVCVCVRSRHVCKLSWCLTYPLQFCFLSHQVTQKISTRKDTLCWHVLDNGLVVGKTQSMGSFSDFNFDPTSYRPERLQSIPTSTSISTPVDVSTCVMVIIL